MPQILKLLNLLLIRIKGADGALAAPTYDVVPQRPELNPELHFSPEKSNTKRPSKFEALAQPRDEKYVGPCQAKKSNGREFGS